MQPYNRPRSDEMEILRSQIVTIEKGSPFPRGV